MRSKAPDLLPLFRSQHQAELLTWLYLHPTAEYPMTELATRFGVPLSTTQREVQRLVDAGLLRDRSIGRSRMLRAATDHPAAEALTRLLTISFGPPAIVGRTFQGLAGVDSVHIYGSWAARYLGHPGPPPNDVDVLVIGSPARADVYAAADVAQDTLGLPVNPTVRSRAQWQDASDALVQQIQASPIVTVIPSPAE
ncbi:winged helix-turn-helix domain-containing protein [Dactylosporangium sp. NPDC050688]|uniref:winged helix-turn-helix domain-containing protein n=1 Tax=Dactylosporangium sp. NPDC050688 TaxID=3157217 RepID=UPI0033CE1E60